MCVAVAVHGLDVVGLMLLFVGSLLEPPAAILLLTPLFVPVTAAAGIDPIHFGMIVTINLAVGMFLPPFGPNLFGAHAMFGTPLPALYRGVVPYPVIDLVALAPITYVPADTPMPLNLLK